MPPAMESLLRTPAPKPDGEESVIDILWREHKPRALSTLDYNKAGGDTPDSGLVIMRLSPDHPIAAGALRLIEKLIGP